MTRPNVLLLVVDSLRADALFGRHIATPVMDDLAARGVAFRQCISTATSTTPSFSCMLTGGYQPRHGVRGLKGYRLAPSAKTMAEAFGDAGYRTYADVTGPLLPETGVLRGFGEEHYREGRSTRFTWRDEAVERIRSHEEPWLTLLHLFETHFPFQAPPHFEERWDRRGYEACVAATDEWLKPFLDFADDNTIVVVTGDHGENYPETPGEIRWRYWALFLRRRGVGKWFPALDERLSEVAGHGFGIDEVLIRVPLVVAGPGVSPRDVDQQVRHVDLFPTLADLCDVPIPATTDGRSLRPLMEGGTVAETPAYVESSGVPVTRGLKSLTEAQLERRRVCAVRTPEWKLVKKGDGTRILYNLDGLYRWDGGNRLDPKDSVYDERQEVAQELEDLMQQVLTSAPAAASGMTNEEEAVVEQHLRDLGYL